MGSGLEIWGVIEIEVVIDIGIGIGIGMYFGIGCGIWCVGLCGIAKWMA